MIPNGKKNNNMCIWKNLDSFEMKRWNGFNGNFICYIIHSRPTYFTRCYQITTYRNHTKYSTEILEIIFILKMNKVYRRKKDIY